MAEWFRAPAISSREEGDVGLSPSPAKIPFSDEILLNNSRVWYMYYIYYIIMIVTNKIISSWIHNQFIHLVFLIYSYAFSLFMLIVYVDSVLTKYKIPKK